MAGLRLEQGQCYGRFSDEPTQEQLAQYFHLDETERRRITRHHRNPNKFGFTVQRGAFRFLGGFLAHSNFLRNDAKTQGFRFIAYRTPRSLAHPSFAASLMANQEVGR